MFKEIRKERKECPICQEERDLSYGIKQEALRVRDEEIPVKARVYHCHAGNHYFADLDDEEEKFQNAYREYRKRKGLLQPEEISQTRGKYGLSQKALARLLGWGEITIQRYETGALQDNAHNTLLFLMRNEETFKEIFKLRKIELSKRDISKIEKKLKELEGINKQLTLDFVRQLRKPRTPLYEYTKIINIGEYKEHKDRELKGKRERKRLYARSSFVTQGECVAYAI